MVLVSDKLSNNTGILQAKLSYREGHKARRGGLETMPLDQHIEGRHSERQACLKIRPAPMHHLLQMADQRQHREHRLDEHPILPLAALTQFQVAGIPLRGMEAGVAQDDHPPINLLNQPFNRLRVFRSANTAHLGRGVGQERWWRVGPSEKYVER